CGKAGGHPSRVGTGVQIRIAGCRQCKDRPACQSRDCEVRKLQHLTVSCPRRAGRMHDEIALHDCSAIELGRRLRMGELDARELTEYFIARIQSCDDKAIFISTAFDRARREAEESARRYSRASPASPFDGVPIAWKDVFDVSGVVT